MHLVEFHGGGHVLGQVHEREPGSVPQLVDEVAVAFDAVFREADVQAKGWMTAEELVNFIAVSESTPGPFAVNVSTYVGGASP